jgi:hypothetical protein
MCRIKLKKFEEAISDFDLAYKYNPPQSIISSGKGFCLINLNKLEDGA